MGIVADGFIEIRKEYRLFYRDGSSGRLDDLWTGDDSPESAVRAYVRSLVESLRAVGYTEDELPTLMVREVKTTTLTGDWKVA